MPVTCPHCGKSFTIKGIGRPQYGISLQEICKAVHDAGGNYSEAAKSLSTLIGKKLDAGFVSLRIKRAGLTKETARTIRH